MIRAARDLFLARRPPQLWRAAANTDDAVDHIARIVADASLTGTRRLVLLAGVPGAGKTLVGMRIAWGTDFVLRGGTWAIDRARGYRTQGNAKVRNPWQLRANAYRVLLTRGRDAHVVFVPSLAELNETWNYLRACGFRELRNH